MSDMKCPFCQQEYIITKDDSCFGQQRCVCRNPNCEFDGWHFPIKLVSELIRTRKELEQSETCCTEWEKQALDYKAENIALSGDLERTRKALSYAIGVIQTVAKMSDKLSREYGETLVEQLDNIQAYCWQEGYVLTHEEDLSKALEQKDKL